MNPNLSQYSHDFKNTGRHDWTRTNLRPPFRALPQRSHRRAYPIIALKYPIKTHKKTRDFIGVSRGNPAFYRSDGVAIITFQ